MSENVVPFPTPEHAKIGFTELSELGLAIENLFSQTVDSTRSLNSPESIKKVKEETAQITEKIATLIDGIDGIRPDMPSVEEFASQAWELLCVPLMHGQDRASITYYGTEEAYSQLIHLYQKKQAELQQRAMESL